MLEVDETSSNKRNFSMARRRVMSTKSTRHHKHTSSIKARKELKRARKKSRHTLHIDCKGILSVHYSNVRKKRTFRPSGDSYHVILCRLPETTNLNKNEPLYAKKKTLDSLEPAMLIFPDRRKGEKFIKETKKLSVDSERFQMKLCDFAVGIIILTDDCVISRHVDIGIAQLKQREKDQRMLQVERLRDLLICEDRAQDTFQIMFKKTAHVFLAKDEPDCNRWFKNIKTSVLLRREEKENSTDKKETSDSDNSSREVEDVNTRKDWLTQARLEKKSRSRKFKSQILQKKKSLKAQPPLYKYLSGSDLKSPKAVGTLLSPLKDSFDDEKLCETSDSFRLERSFSSRVVEALTHMLSVPSLRKNFKQQHTLTLQQLKKMIETKKHQAEQFLDQGGKKSKLECAQTSSQTVLPLLSTVESELSETSQNQAIDSEEMRPSLEILSRNTSGSPSKSPRKNSGLNSPIKCNGVDVDCSSGNMNSEEELYDFVPPRLDTAREGIRLSGTQTFLNPAPVSFPVVPQQKSRLRSQTWAKPNLKRGALSDEMECKMVQLKIYPVPTEYDGDFFEKLTEMLFQFNLIGGSTRIVVSKKGKCRFYVRQKAVENGTILLFQDKLHDKWKHLYCIVDRSRAKVKKLVHFIDCPFDPQPDTNPPDSVRSVKSSCGQFDTSNIVSSDDEIDPSKIGRILPRRYSLRATEDCCIKVQVIGNDYRTLTLDHNAQIRHLIQRLDDMVRDWKETHHFCSDPDSEVPVYLNDQNETTVVALYSHKNRITVLTLPRCRTRIASTIFRFENDYSNWEDQTLKGIFFDEWRTEDKTQKRFCESYLINFFRLFIVSKPFELRIFASFYLNLQPILLDALTPKLSSLLEESLKSTSIPEDIKEHLQTYLKHLVGTAPII